MAAEQRRVLGVAADQPLRRPTITIVQTMFLTSKALLSRKAVVAAKSVATHTMALVITNIMPEAEDAEVGPRATKEKDPPVVVAVDEAVRGKSSAQEEFEAVELEKLTEALVEAQLSEEEI